MTDISIKEEFMAINNVQTTISISGKEYLVTQYGVDIASPEPLDNMETTEIIDEYDDIVIVTDDYSNITTLIDMLEEDDFHHMKDETGNRVISVIDLNGVYVIKFDYEYFLPNKPCDFIFENFINFGSDNADNVSIRSCFLAYHECVGKDDPEQVYDDFLENKGNTFHDDKLESSLDYYTGLLNYVEDRQHLDRIMDKLSSLIIKTL